MPGLLDFTPDDWLTLAGGLLSGRGDIGSALMGAQVARSRRMDAQSMRELQQLQLEQARRGMAQDDQQRQLAARFYRPEIPGGDVGPGAPESFDLRGYAAAQAAGGNPSLLMQMQPKPAVPIKLGLNERLVDPTTNKTIIDAAPAEKKPKEPVRVDLGDRVDFLDPETFSVIHSTRKGLAPERPDKPEKPPAGYRWVGDRLEPVSGGPADPKTAAGRGQPTEDERRSAGLAVRLESALREMQQFPKDVKPEVLPSVVRPVLGDTFANIATTENRQKTESAQLDALDAALTLATGAAYTKEQLKNLSRSYFPQLGDQPGTIAAKEARFKEIIQSARIRAGRAEGEINRGGTPGLEALLNKYAPK